MSESAQQILMNARGAGIFNDRADDSFYNIEDGRRCPLGVLFEEKQHFERFNFDDICGCSTLGLCEHQLLTV